MPTHFVIATLESAMNILEMKEAFNAIDNYSSFRV